MLWYLTSCDCLFAVAASWISSFILPLPMLIQCTGFSHFFSCKSHDSFDTWHSAGLGDINKVW